MSGPYPIWLRQIASKLAKTDRCLNVIGHTSRSGPEPVNESSQSGAGAEHQMWRLESATPDLVTRVKATGMGFPRKRWLAPAADDLSDLRDRRGGVQDRRVRRVNTLRLASGSMAFR